MREASGSNTVSVVLTIILIITVMYTLLENSVQGLRYYPVLVNATLLTVFGRSLISGMPMVEKLALLRDPELSAAAIRYTRKVTQVWCVFFLLNGLTALFLAIYASFELWALYNGFIAYILMGLLFGTEAIFRRRVKRGNDAQA